MYTNKLLNVLPIFLPILQYVFDYLFHQVNKNRELKDSYSTIKVMVGG